MDDHEIVDLYWQRDEHAIEATAAKYESYCMKISQNILSDRADSEENVNDTYLHAWQFPRLSPRCSPTSCVLRTMPSS